MGDFSSPATATERIHQYAWGKGFGIALTKHATERMQERGLTTTDIIHVLKYGFVYELPEPTAQHGLFKCKMEGTTPNSNGRFLCVITVPSPLCADVKIVTVMWQD